MGVLFKLVNLHSNQSGTRFMKYNYDLTNLDCVDFKCNICNELFTRPENANMEDDKALSISLKVHDQSHNYHNEWITERRIGNE